MNATPPAATAATFTAKPRPRNWLLLRVRELHIWLGLVAAAWLVVVGATGILLNHKGLFLRSRGEEKPVKPDKPEKPARPDAPKGPKEKPGGGKGRPGAVPPATAAITLEQALARAREQWSDEPVQKIELKKEQGVMLYRLRNARGEELILDAAGQTTESGAPAVKGGPGGSKGPGGKPGGQRDLGKLLLDVHTGRIFGEAGRVAVSLLSGVMLFLTASGVWIWLWPKLRRKPAPPKPAAV